MFSSWDQAAIAWLLLLGLMYVSGVRRLRTRGAAPPALERTAFAGGWVALLCAVLPWLDAAALARFSAHMAQHELMMIVGAPLLMAGRPVATSLWALPDNWRQRAAAASRNRWVRRLVDRATLPWVAWAGHGLAVWIWHAPVLYRAALQNEGVHAMQHAMFIGASILFWSGLLNGRYGRAGYGAAVLYVFTTAVHTGTLGALLPIAPNPIYAEYVAQGGNGNALADQQVAGLLMWIPAGLLMTILAWRFLAAGIGAAGAATDSIASGPRAGRDTSVAAAADVVSGQIDSSPASSSASSSSSSSSSTNSSSSSVSDAASTSSG